MKQIKTTTRIVSALICAVFILSLVVVAFPDVDMNTTQGKAIATMREKGYINGFDDGTFRPEATLTRAEFVTIVNEMYGYYVESENIFSDIKSDDWFYHDVVTAVQAGYIKGMGDGRFAPNEPVTREQVCVMLDAILMLDEMSIKPEITDKVSDWAQKSVEKLVALYLFTLEDGGRFRGTQPITRGETCAVLEKCIVDIDFEEIFQPIDLEMMAHDKLESMLAEIIKCMEEEVIPTYTFEETIKVGNMVVDSMKKYLEDDDFDYVAAAQETYEVYRKFNGARANEFKNPIYEKMDIEELAILFDFFYVPEIRNPQ